MGGGCRARWSRHRWHPIIWKGSFVLEAIVVLLAILVVGNMLLTWGMVRRLRSVQEQIDGAFSPLENGLGLGDEAPDFVGQTLAGDTVTRDSIVHDETVLAFFSPSCDACEAHLPAVRQLAVHPNGTPTVVAVIDGVAAESGRLIEGLHGDVQMLFASRVDNDLLKDYQVNVYPSYYVIGSDGRIAGSHTNVSEFLASSQP